MMSVASMPATLALNSQTEAEENKPEEMVAEAQNFGGTQKLGNTLTNMLGGQESHTRQ